MYEITIDKERSHEFEKEEGNEYGGGRALLQERKGRENAVFQRIKIKLSHLQ